MRVVFPFKTRATPGLYSFNVRPYPRLGGRLRGTHTASSYSRYRTVLLDKDNANYRGSLLHRKMPPRLATYRRRFNSYVACEISHGAEVPFSQ